MKIFSYQTLVFVTILSLFSTTAPTISKAVSITDGLVAHWKLDETPSTTFLNSVDNSIDWQVTGNPQQVTGRYGNAFLFNNPGQTSFRSEHPEGFGLLSSFSISFWIKTSADSANAIFGENTLQLTIALCEGGKIGISPFKNAPVTCSSTAINDGEWHHVVFTHNESTGEAQLVIDDSIDSTASSALVWSGKSPFEFVSFAFNRTAVWGTTDFEGTLDDVRIYDRAISSNDISGIYNYVAPVFVPETDGGNTGGADQNTNPGGFVPETDGGNTGGADQNTNPDVFVPETDGGNTGGADQNTNPGGLVPDTDGGNTGGADTGSNDQNQQEAAQEDSRSSGRISGSSKKPVALVSAATPKLPSLTDIGSCIYIKDYLNIRGSNNPTEVTKLQTFLLNTEKIDVPVNGVFDQETFDAVKVFQTKYLDDIMTPWGLEVASGVVSYTTKKKINEIYCKITFSLTPEQLAAIESYKNREISDPAIAPETFVAPDNVEVGFAQPEEVIVDETLVETEQPTETPVVEQTQTASALDAGGGFFEKIMNFFKRIF